MLFWNKRYLLTLIIASPAQVKSVPLADEESKQMDTILATDPQLLSSFMDRREHCKFKWSQLLIKIKCLLPALCQNVHFGKYIRKIVYSELWLMGKYAYDVYISVYILQRRCTLIIPSFSSFTSICLQMNGINYEARLVELLDLQNKHGPNITGLYTTK